jgi:hypothetical protein
MYSSRVIKEENSIVDQQLVQKKKIIDQQPFFQNIYAQNYQISLI